MNKNINIKQDEETYIHKIEDIIHKAQKNIKNTFTLREIIQGEHIQQREKVWDIIDIDFSNASTKITETMCHIQKKKEAATNLTEKIIYTIILSKIHDTLYEKENNKSQTQIEKLLYNIEPGDLLFVSGGGVINKDGKQQNTSLASKALEGFGGIGNHVAIIGKNKKTLIQATLKKYNKKRNGIDKVPLIQELNHRPGARIIIGRVKKGSTIDSLQKAEEILQNEIMFDRMAVIRSILKKKWKIERINTKNTINCANLIHKCYPNIPHTGIPADIMNSDQIDLTYTMQRQ